MTRPLFVGIAGGTASGKTSLARRLQSEVTEESSLLVELDSYYQDLSHLDFEARAAFNFDHPDAFDWEHLRTDLEHLLAGEAVAIPTYDYAQHTRHPGKAPSESRPVLMLEGILALWPLWLRELMDIRIFVDIPDDLRLLRRVRRDTVDRGRDVAGVLNQYERQVRPMHLEFCEPTKVHADVIIPRGGHNRVALDMVSSAIRQARPST